MGVIRAWTNLFFTPVFTPILTFPLEGGRDLGLRKGRPYGATRTVMMSVLWNCWCLTDEA